MTVRKIVFLIPLLLCVYFRGNAQYSSLNAHSHNDYEQKVPFFEAYYNHFGSIEADIWEVNGELFVAHEKEKITPDRTLDKLYIHPIVKIYQKNGGKAWADHFGGFQLMIELKSATEPALSLLVSKLEKYPEVFDPSLNANAVKVVITGNRPDPSRFCDYPRFIYFDGLPGLHYSELQRNRVALFSNNLEEFTSWKGKGRIPESEERRLRQIIDSVHQLNCKIRFWNAPDTPSAWQMLMDLQVDYINTDHINELERFLKGK
jgi:alkaline phosphatase